ncbi:MAG: magnesium transporter, partial [Nitrososphaera sp.]|nr:magnesium transporter [Nitrososphaera sp.]
VVDYIYVVNGQNRLQGVASLKEILQSPDESRISIIMRKPVALDFHADQERLVYFVLKHNLKAVPVVDPSNHLKGVVPYKTILETNFRLVVPST